MRHARFAPTAADAGDLDVRIGGGPATIRQFLKARLVDELHVVVAPVLLGTGERLFTDDRELGDHYACTQSMPSEAVMHVRLERR